jgi:hypothetical protein
MMDQSVVWHAFVSLACAGSAFVDPIFFVIGDCCCVESQSLLDTFVGGIENCFEDLILLALWSGHERCNIGLVVLDDSSELSLIRKSCTTGAVSGWVMIPLLLCPMLWGEKPRWC